MKIEEALKIEKGVAYEVNDHWYINLNKDLFYDTLDAAQKLNFDTSKKYLKELDNMLGSDYKEFDGLASLVPEIMKDFQESYQKLAGGLYAYFNNINAKKWAEDDESGKNVYFIRDGVLGLADKNSFEVFLKKDSLGLEKVLSDAVVKGKKSIEKQGLYI